jgi:hypothetical protein
LLEQIVRGAKDSAREINAVPIAHLDVSLDAGHALNFDSSTQPRQIYSPAAGNADSNWCVAAFVVQLSPCSA